MFYIGLVACFHHSRLVSGCIVPRYRNRTQLSWFQTRFASKSLISALVRVAIHKVQNNFHNRSVRRATSKYMEIIHETKKNATPLVNGSAVPRGTARHAAANLLQYAVLIQLNSISEAWVVRQRTVPHAM
jgi:hypothetical protein